MATMKKKAAKSSKSLKKYEYGGNNTMPTRAGRILRSIFPRAYGINPNPLGPDVKGKMGYGTIQGAEPSGGKLLEPARKKGGSTKSKVKPKKK